MRSTFETERFGKKKERAAGVGLVVLFLLLLASVFVGIWIGVFLHLSGWGIVFGILALLERLFRVIKIHFKRNGRYWINL